MNLCPSCRAIVAAKQAAIHGLCRQCNVHYANMLRCKSANIPAAYWSTIELEHPALQKLLDAFTRDTAHSYSTGKRVCLAGSHGIGKTTCATEILKRVTAQGYTAFYMTVPDAISQLTDADSEHRYELRRTLQTDFLVLDELDPRHIANSDAASDLFGRTIESIIRHRIQNVLPFVLVTNSPNPLLAFNGSVHASLESLFRTIEQVNVIGDDKRARQ